MALLDVEQLADHLEVEAVLPHHFAQGLDLSGPSGRCSSSGRPG